MSKEKFLTSAMAGAHLGYSPDYIRRLCSTGKLKAEKVGNNWLINEKAVKNFKPKQVKE